MRTISNPRQTILFDSFDPVLSPRTRADLLSDWQGVFRHVLLEQMPVDVLAKPFDPSLGRPTKELYSMAGLLFLKEFMNWTEEQCLDAYRYRLDVHYALNLEPVAHDLSPRTLERYSRIFIQNELAARVMHEVTTTLAQQCEVKMEQQRLDSTHIFSDMASFGRTRMMGVTIKRFLHQVKRNDAKAYADLEETLRKRYEPSPQKLFDGLGKDREGRRLLRQQVAEDMYTLIRHFADHVRHNGRSTYLMMVRIFSEQCEIVEAKVVVRAKTGGNLVQNPSEPDGTYDKHKGPGYQVQIAQTCHPENEIQLITCGLPQTAVVSDAGSMTPVLDDLEGQGRLPQSMLADSMYGSDENVQEAIGRGVELVSPTKEGARAAERPQATDPTDSLNIADFVIDEKTEVVTACPAGIAPETSTYDPAMDQTTTIMPASACEHCERLGICPVRKTRRQYRIDHMPKQRRLALRRREERTEAFRKRYQLRAGIEGTNSGLKRRVGLARLRVRGKARVFNAILLKLAGWNLLQAAVCTKMRAIVAQRAKAASPVAIFGYMGALIRHFSLAGDVFEIAGVRSDNSGFRAGHRLAA
jgi:hypothetical protein